MHYINVNISNHLLINALTPAEADPQLQPGEREDTTVVCIKVHMYKWIRGKKSNWSLTCSEICACRFWSSAFSVRFSLCMACREQRETQVYYTAEIKLQFNRCELKQWWWHLPACWSPCWRRCSSQHWENLLGSFSAALFQPA